MTAVPSFDAFAGALSAYFELPMDWFRHDSDLVDDAGMDSLMVIEVVEMLEQAAGHILHDQAIESLATVGDVYNFYVQLCAGDPSLERRASP